MRFKDVRPGDMLVHETYAMLIVGMRLELHPDFVVVDCLVCWDAQDWYHGHNSFSYPSEDYALYTVVRAE